MRILGIETSCDETSAAVVDNGVTLLSNVVSSSLDLHAQYGGVVPEIAARSHIEAIIPVIDQALTLTPNSELRTPVKDPWSSIDGIAVTSGPGLSGSLLIGAMTARTLAVAKNKPLWGINHVEGHVYANFLIDQKPVFPLIALIVSGGHTQLVYFKDHFDYEVLGQTVDDAIGEAFDKVAKIVGLPYPGGPSIAEAAASGDPLKFKLPIPKAAGDYNFSYSGLKTAVLRLAQHLAGGDFRMPSAAIPPLLKTDQVNDLAACFQRTAIMMVVDKTKQAWQEYQPASVVIAGGVAANRELRRILSESLPLPLNYAPMNLCTDNAAFVASLGGFKALKNITPDDPYSLTIDPNLKM